MRQEEIKFGKDEVMFRAFKLNAVCHDCELQEKKQSENKIPVPMGVEPMTTHSRSTLMDSHY